MFSDSPELFSVSGNPSAIEKDVPIEKDAPVEEAMAGISRSGVSRDEGLADCSKELGNRRQGNRVALGPDVTQLQVLRWPARSSRRARTSLRRACAQLLGGNWPGASDCDFGQKWYI